MEEASSSSGTTTTTITSSWNTFYPSGFTVWKEVKDAFYHQKKQKEASNLGEAILEENDESVHLFPEETPRRYGTHHHD